MSQARAAGAPRDSTGERGGRRFGAAGSGPAEPILSIATVVRNGAAVLPGALDSVLRRKLPEVELIVVDGASTDGTVELLRAAGEQIDCWISEPDAGIYDAMNKARRLARGGWLLFLGADDRLAIDLRTLVAALRDPRTVYYGDVEIASSGRRSGGAFNRYRLMQENICHQAICYPAAVYRTKAYDTRAGVLADHKYNIELRGAGAPFRHLPWIVSVFDDRGQSSGDIAYFEPIKLEAIRRHFGLPFFLLKVARTALARWLKARRPRGSAAIHR